LFEKLAPFSEKLGRIADGKKFMTAISRDMLKTVIAREERHFSLQNKD